MAQATLAMPAKENEKVCVVCKASLCPLTGTKFFDEAEVIEVDTDVAIQG